MLQHSPDREWREWLVQPPKGCAQIGAAACEFRAQLCEKFGCGEELFE
eukprot:gene14944-49309_t